MTFHSFRLGLGFPLSSAGCFKTCQRWFRQTFPVSYQRPPQAALGAVGQDQREEKKEPREGEKRRGGKTDWQVSSLRWHGDEREKILKIKKEAWAASCQQAGNHAFISWNIESMSEWKNRLDGSLFILSTNRLHNSFPFHLFFSLQCCLSSSLPILRLLSLLVTLCRQVRSRMTHLPVNWIADTLTVDLTGKLTSGLND